MAHTRRIEVEGAELAYDREPEGSGPPIVFLHAGIANRTMWDGVVERLPDRPWLRYDLRGFGESTLPDGPYAVYRDLLGLLDALDIDRAVVCGISFGGGVAIDAAIAAPDRVAALVAACTGPFGAERDDALMEQSEEADRAGEAGDVERALELETRIWVDGPKRRPEDVDPAFRRHAIELNRTAWQAGMGGDGQALEPLAVGRLGEIRAPTLVVDAELDQPSTRRSCQLLADQIPGAKLVVMRGVAHLAPLEQPEPFARELVRFLDAAGV